MATSTPKSDNLDSFNVKTAFEELEQIVKDFESAQLDLEESIPKFKRALEIAKKLKTRLTEIENQIIEIKSEYQLEPNQPSTAAD